MKVKREKYAAFRAEYDKLEGAERYAKHEEMVRLRKEANDAMLDVATLIGGLREMDVIDKKEEKILRSAISDRALSTPSASKDALRAGILKEMLLALLSEEE